MKACGKKNFLLKPMLITYKHLSFGSNILIRDGARIEGVDRHLESNYKPLICIKDKVIIEQNLHLTCAESIEIGSKTAIAANVTISDIIHPYHNIALPSDEQPLIIKSVTIGENCKIYNNAVILPGTKLGRHCIVGANTVVTGKYYDDYCVIVGSPSKIIKRYSVDKKEWLKTDKNGNFIN